MRINLSEQTDMMDLLGADLPVEGGAARGVCLGRRAPAGCPEGRRLGPPGRAEPGRCEERLSQVSCIHALLSAPVMCCMLHCRYPSFLFELPGVSVSYMMESCAWEVAC